MGAGQQAFYRTQGQFAALKRAGDIVALHVPGQQHLVAHHGLPFPVHPRQVGQAQRQARDQHRGFHAAGEDGHFQGVDHLFRRVTQPGSRLGDAQPGARLGRGHGQRGLGRQDRCFEGRAALEQRIFRIGRFEVVQQAQPVVVAVVRLDLDCRAGALLQALEALAEPDDGSAQSATPSEPAAAEPEPEPEPEPEVVSEPAPETVAYPGGKERNRWHMQQGIELMKRYLGVRPKGVWLSEGGVSDDAMDLLDEFAIAWTATGEGVWRNSSQKSGFPEDEVHSRRGLFSPYTHADNRVELFFRDDGLSDLIGFEYSNWHADDAIVDFIKHLRNIRTFLDQDSDKHVVSVILDGENAWEYYPDNGASFLDGLYKALAEEPEINVMTFSDAVESDIETREMEKLCPGSWVYGSFSTWIGEKDKNRAWELLVEAKQAYDAVIGRNVLTAEEERLATQQLAVCEGSDWFWWFGDYNSPESVSDFEQLFRRQLRSLYRLLHLPEPPVLDEPVSAGGSKGAVNAGTMRRN